MKQVHDYRNNSLEEVVEWLKILTTETNADGSDIHTIQQFQVVPEIMGVQFYRGIVLCDHNEHFAPVDPPLPRIRRRGQKERE